MPRNPSLGDYINDALDNHMGDFSIIDVAEEEAISYYNDDDDYDED